MSAITSFSPIQSINSLLRPLGLTISNKQQIINKAALVALAMLVVTCGLVEVEGQGNVWDVDQSRTLTKCLKMCAKIQIPPEGAACDRSGRDDLIALLARCNRACQKRFN